jgi:hypothetical protein
MGPLLRPERKGDQVIGEHEAEEIVATLLGDPRDEPDRSWELEEFSDGWLVEPRQAAGEMMIGAAPLVVERETGQVRQFPSSVPPHRITEEYADIRDEGYEVRANE